MRLSKQLFPDDAAVGSPELLTKRETLELVRAYYKIADPAIRKHGYSSWRARYRIEADCETAEMF